jgi:hypothetical protein
MGLKEEFLSDAVPGECLSMVETDMNHVRNGEIGTLVVRRYVKDGKFRDVEQFVSRGPVNAAPATEEAEKKPGLISKLFGGKKKKPAK